MQYLADDEERGSQLQVAARLVCPTSADGLEIVAFEEDIQTEAKAVLAKHPKLVAEKKQRYAADPFVIAVAAVQNRKIVTEQKPTAVQAVHEGQ